MLFGVVSTKVLLVLFGGLILLLLSFLFGRLTGDAYAMSRMVSDPSWLQTHVPGTWSVRGWTRWSTKHLVFGLTWLTILACIGIAGSLAMPYQTTPVLQVAFVAHVGVLTLAILYKSFKSSLPTPLRFARMMLGTHADGQAEDIESLGWIDTE